MSERRIYNILILLGAGALVAGVIGFTIVDAYVPDVMGTDPQKEQYENGWLSVGAVGVALILTGAMSCLMRRQPTKEEVRGFPVQQAEDQLEQR